ncbi:glycosyltransferase [Rathayibacter caricis]|uniref:glycosyltransferase n=1 Tax=Rathayibacter caricis TaxID=110936 RepID=UPI001FB24845|nr:glycosyltransferase [Rathayibacter caricis]MCJ1694906.1 glycosyltransferase [Rathayibacter caricis]
MRPSVAIIGTRGYPSYYGGFETAVRRLAPWLVDQGWDVTVYGRSGATVDDDSVRDPRVKSVFTPGLESRTLSTLSYGLTASLHAAFVSRPDVVLVMNVANGYFLPLLRLLGVPSLVNVDGIEWERSKWGSLAKAMFKVGAFLTARSAHELVFDARAIEARWAAEFGRTGVFIPYGGDEVGALPTEDGLDRRGYALMVARFVPENTVGEFLDAAEEIAAKRPVIIVGSSGYGGALEEKVGALAARNANVRWLGHVSDDRRLFGLLQNTGAYFHGHSVGGTNPALVQAMAVAAPTVARDTVYNREVLGSDGTFTAADPSSIAHAVIAMLEDPDSQERSSANSLARSRAHYTWDGVCRSYEQSLSRLLPLSRARRRRNRA